MNRQPNVMIGIVTYGSRRASSLCQVIESAMAQTVEPQEIVIVDNASCPEIQETLRRYPKVKYIDPGENTGPAGGYCRIILHARANKGTDFLLLLGDDSLLSTKDAIEIYLEEFQRIKDSIEPNLGCLTCTRGELTINLKITKGRLVRCQQQSDPYGVHLCGNSGLFVNRNVFENVNYRQDLFFGIEDFYFCASIFKAGYKIYKIPHNLITFTEPIPVKSTIRFMNKQIILCPCWKTYYGTRNYLVFYKYLFGQQSIAFILLTIKTIATAFILMITGHLRHSKYMLMGLFDFFRNKMGKTIEPEGYDEN